MHGSTNRKNAKAKSQNTQKMRKNIKSPCVTTLSTSYMFGTKYLKFKLQCHKWFIGSVLDSHRRSPGFGTTPAECDKPNWKLWLETYSKQRW